jgi:hypothetical protein
MLLFTSSVTTIDTLLYDDDDGNDDLKSKM